MQWMDLHVKVAKVEGFCPVYQVGDSFILEQGYQLNCSKSCTVCMHALGSLLSFIVPLSAGLPLEDLGLGHEEEGIARVQCLDPGPPSTAGGTVTFEITRTRHEENA